MNLYKLHNNPDELVGYTDRNFYLGDEARDLLLQGKKLTKHIVGNVDLNNDLITALPDNLHITGDLWLIDTPIKTIGKNLSVGGNLLLTNTPIASLPDNLSVGMHLYINGTPNLDKNNLPSSLAVKGAITGTGDGALIGKLLGG